MTEPYDPEALAEVIEYFDQRADVEIPNFTSVPNEEMRHLVAAKSAQAEIERLNARVVEAERERDAYKAMSFDNAVRSSGWMLCHDQLMAWIQDRQAVLNEFMDSDPRTAFPSPSDVPTLQAAEFRALAAEQKLQTVRRDALEEAVKLVASFGVPPIPKEGVLNMIIQRDFAIAGALRALKSTPPPGAGTRSNA